MSDLALPYFPPPFIHSDCMLAGIRPTRLQYIRTALYMCVVPTGLAAPPSPHDIRLDPQVRDNLAGTDA